MRRTISWASLGRARLEAEQSRSESDGSDRGFVPSAWTVRPDRYLAAVPRISAFYGIVIYMYIRDHGPPHLHAWASDQRAVIDIRTGSITLGSLRSRQAGLVRAWVDLHRDELLAAWDRASRGDAPGTIEPLP